MYNRTIAEQICAVLVLELNISKKEAERFLAFYDESSHRFDFKDGIMKGGWFLKGHAVGGDPLLRQKHKKLVAGVNGMIQEILRSSLVRQEVVRQVTQMA